MNHEPQKHTVAKAAYDALLPGAKPEASFGKADVQIQGSAFGRPPGLAPGSSGRGQKGNAAGDDGPLGFLTVSDWVASSWRSLAHYK